MRRLMLLCLLLLVPSLALGATKFVRAVGGSYGTEDGTSYANAFDGAVLGLAGLSAGDTLYICGAHTEKFTASVNGASGSRITLDGNCSGDAGSIVVGSAQTAAIALPTTANDFYTIQNLTLSGGTTATVFCDGDTPSCDTIIVQDNLITCTHPSVSSKGINIRSPKDATIQRNTVNGTSQACIAGILLDTTLSSPDANILKNNYIGYNTVFGFKNYGIRFKGLDINNVMPGPQTVTYNTLYSNDDNIYHESADRITNSYNISHDSVAGEGYCFASTWADLGIWEYNTGYNCKNKGIETYADSTRPGTGVIIRGNHFYDANVAGIGFRCTIDVNNGTPASTGWTGVVVVANVIERGKACGINISAGTTAVVDNNTLVNVASNRLDGQEEGGIFLESNAANVTVTNNLCAAMTVRCIWRSNATGANVTFSNNLFQVSGQSTLATAFLTSYTSGTITSLDAGAVVGDPLLTSTYRTTASSPARAAGVASSYCLDARGRPCRTPPDIGAYQASSGDPAATRTARQQYIFQPVASSTFSSGNANPISEGGVWATNQSGGGSFQISAAIANPTDLTQDSGARYIGTGFNQNQYSRGNLTITGTAGGGSGIGLEICASSSARTLYRFTIDHNTTTNAFLYRFVAGSGSLLTGGSWLQTFSDGDQFSLANVGETIYVFKGSTLVKTIDDTGGGVGCASTRFPGLAFSSTETSASVDNWSGGNFRLAY